MAAAVMAAATMAAATMAVAAMVVALSLSEITVAEITVAKITAVAGDAPPPAQLLATKQQSSPYLITYITRVTPQSEQQSPASRA
jgi:hypothetical protein